MKVLILTVTSGEGHNSIAKAVSDRLSQINVDNIVYDLFKRKLRLHNYITNDCYINACKYCKDLLTFCYKDLQKRNPLKREHTMVSTFIKPAKDVVYELITQYKPDVVFCTHVFAARLMCEYKREYPTAQLKVVSMLTDYSVHPYWETAVEVDYLLTPSNVFDNILMFKGYKKSQLVCTGIPVNTKFSVQKDKADALRSLGLRDDLVTILIMFGGGGLANNYKIVKTLNKINADFQIIVTNGHNEKSKLKIDKAINKGKFNKTILNLGFVNNVDVLMAASNCMISKPGCISINEALNKKVPLIFMGRPTSQEKDNVNFLIKHNLCIYINKFENLYSILEESITSTTRLDAIVNNIPSVSKPNAVKDTADFLIKICQK